MSERNQAHSITVRVPQDVAKALRRLAQEVGLTVETLIEARLATELRLQRSTDGKQESARELPRSEDLNSPGGYL